MRQRTTPTQEQGTNQPTRTHPNRKCNGESETQFESESDSAIGLHLLESNRCARNYFDSRFKILNTTRSQFHLSLWEAVRIYPLTVSIRSKPAVSVSIAFLFTIDCAILKCIFPYCRLHFSLVHMVVKRSCSPHTKADRDRNRRVLSEKLIVQAKCNQLYGKSYSNSSQPQNCGL